MIFQFTPFVVSLLQITLIGTFAWLLNWTIRSRSAQSRHAIWIAALAAIALTLPSKWIFSPLEVSSDWLVRNAEVDEPLEPNPIGEAESAASLIEPSMITGFGEQAFATTFQSADVATQHYESGVRPSLAQASYRWSMLDGLIFLYALGIVFMASRMVIAAVRLRWMYRQGFDLSRALRQKAERTATAVSLTRTPRIRICQAVRSPLAFGILRPTVLLPESFCDWSAACQQSVLTHELVHVARRDSIWDFLAQVISAMYWFHPVVHWVTRSLKRERELSTDECVVAAGVDCIQYAIHLIDVLSEATPKSPLSGAMEMSHFGDTQSRLASVLRMSGQHPKRSRVASFLGVIVFFTLSTTSFQLIAQSPSTQSLSSPSEFQQERGSGVQSVADIPTVQPKAAEPKLLVDELPEDQGNFFDRITTANLMQVREPDNTYSISGTVIGTDKKPAAGAIVAVRVLRAAPIAVDLAYRPDELIARTTADESGRYRFDNVPGIAELGTVIRTWQVIAAQPNGDFGWGSIDPDFDSNTIPKTANISLRGCTTISGVYTGPSGDPIPNATVILSGLYDRDFRDNGIDHAAAISLVYSSLGMQVKSDEQGCFEFASVPQGWVAGVVLIHDEWAISHAIIRTSDDIKIGFRDPDGPKHSLNWDVRASGSTIVGTKGYLINGVVRTSDGAPVGNCVVFSSFQVGATTNANGEFSHRILPSEFHITGKPQDVTVRVYPRDISRGLIRTEITLTELQAASGDKLSIELQKGIPLVGRVLSEQGKPIGAVHVMALPKGTRLFDHRSRSHRSSSTAPDGSFRMVVPEGVYGLYVWGSMSPYSLPDGRTRAIDLGPAQSITATQSKFTDSGKPLEVPAIKVSESERVPVRCVDEQGNPVAGAKLTLIHRPPSVGNMRPDQTNAAPQGVSDEKGQFTFRPPTVYASDLVARASLETDSQHLWGEVILPANPIGIDNVVILKPMWRISGKVTVDGMPMQDVRVMVWRNGPGISHSGSHSMNGDGLLVDANGQYEWFVPPNGSYYVEMWESPFTENPSGNYSVHEVGKNEFQADEIRFTFAEGVISGRVTHADGTPVSDIRVSSIPKFGDPNRVLLANPSLNTRRSVTREDGSFTIEGLPAGQYQITASSIAKPKTHYITTALASVGDRNVHIIVTPIE